MKGALAELPPVDPNLAPGLADGDLERRIRTLRTIIRNEASPSLRRMAQAELRGIAHTIGWDAVEAVK